MMSVSAQSVPSNYNLVDASWAAPTRTAPFDDYLVGTRHKIDTSALKSLPIETRLNGAVDIFGSSGITGTKALAIYDRVGLFSAPWVWWLLQSHGCDAVVVEGWSVTTSTAPEQKAATFESKCDPSRMNAMKRDVLAAIDSDIQIIDARPAARFSGQAAEPRPGSRSGRIPGSLNVPFPDLKDGRFFHHEAQLRTVFDQAGIDLARPIITTCGSGVTASGLAYALQKCGASNIRVYQGSWAEWSMDSNLPVELNAS